jgi:flagellar hook-associated protein 3 FlgL
MKTTFISTSAISGAARQTLARLQSQLVEAQKEVSTGRYADVGASLGAKTGQVVSLRQEHTRLAGIIDSNGAVAARLAAAHSALETVGADAQNFLDQLAAAGSAEVQRVLQGEARSGLASLTGMLNTQLAGTYLFAGINGDVKPIADYEQSPTGAAKQAVADAFLTAFGFAQSDPAAAGISADAMQAFLDGPFAALFADPAWGNTWSQAADQNVRSRISGSELIETSANANVEAVRKLASAYTMVADLGGDNLNDDAFQRIAQRASELIAEAAQGLTAVRSDLGFAQQRIADANTRMSLQRDIISKHIGAIEGVDPYEASTRLSALITQVETAYAMTSRISKLTLLNYLP